MSFCGALRALVLDGVRHVGPELEALLRAVHPAVVRDFDHRVQRDCLPRHQLSVDVHEVRVHHAQRRLEEEGMHSASSQQAGLDFASTGKPQGIRVCLLRSSCQTMDPHEPMS